ncbi:MAG: hypothetical protein LAP40_16370 [Acidobacteriia bacterium]|nr:hypothetical protein [Terriglobia bacterium]
MRPFPLPDSDEVLAELVHDLRQPLGTLEYSACYLQLLLSEPREAVQEQLRIIQQQLDIAARLLTEAAARVARPVQRTAAGESLDLTKSEIAAVT